MTIEAIVERGTFALNDSPYLGPSGTPDLAKFGTSIYSDKPPVLSLLGAAVYAPLSLAGYHMFDMRSPQHFMDSFMVVNGVLVAILVAIPSGMVLYGLRRLFQTIFISRWLADMLVIGFGLCSLLLTYGVTFNNHSVASGLLTIAFASIILCSQQSRNYQFGLLLAGFATALAASIDMPAGGAVWVAILIWMALRSRRCMLRYLAGSLPPFVLHCVTQSMVTGSPLPVELYPKALEYEGSYWASEAGVYSEVGSRTQFLVELLVGPQGWLTVSPFLIFAPAGFVILTITRHSSIRSGTIVLTVITVVLLIYYSYGVRRIDYSGQSFGVRHFLPITPLVYWLAVASLEYLRHRLWRLIFTFLILVGFVYSTAGMKDPWSRIEQRDDTSLRLIQRFVISSYTSYNR